ncbi:MAG: hypothetical protein H8E66_15060 [Planctomycetes bacterium]|nr:hypothetical protein [Planctomycetota bacterium]
MTKSNPNRREILKAGICVGATTTIAGRSWSDERELASTTPARQPYDGPNIVIIRFGGGARRRETIDPDHTFSPFLCHEFSKRGTLFPLMEIAEEDGVETGHGQGTLNILTGKYDKYKDVKNEFMAERFETAAPTLFEYLRKAFDVPEHQALMVNGEDRKDEEFYTFSNHRKFGYPYRSNVLSLYRFKTFLLRQQIANGKMSEQELREKKNQLAEFEKFDYRAKKETLAPELEEFWRRWQRYYGQSGFVNPRGDRLLTELTTRALDQLRPKLIMVNYNDCDYVHWGNINHYTRAVSIMDMGLKEIVSAVTARAEYRDNTIFIVVPDCGRDNNRFASIPCQHHFNSRSSREIFGLFVGPGIAEGQVVDRRIEQIGVAPTVAHLMGTGSEFAEGEVLEEAIA